MVSSSAILCSTCSQVRFHLPSSVRCTCPVPSGSSGLAWRDSVGCGAGEDFNYPATTGERPHKSWAERQIGAYIADLIEIAPQDASVFSDIIPVHYPYYNIAHSSELFLQERPWCADFRKSMPVLRANFMYALSPSSHKGRLH